MFAGIETRFRPDVRWWLAEGLNTDETLRKNIRAIHDLGFGAAEFLAMPDPGADSSIYGWGSQEWTSDTQLIIREATRLGLGFSLTSGAHWATANLPDTFVWRGEEYSPDSIASCKELDYATVLLKPGERFSGALPLCRKPEAVSGDAHGAETKYSRFDFQGVVAARLLKKREKCGQNFGYAEGEGTGVLAKDSLTDLTGLCAGGDRPALDWTAPKDGEYALFVYWMHGTGQTARPSVSTNYTINYLDPYGVQALIEYWEREVLTGEMRGMLRENGRGEIYMDSLEIQTFGAGGLLWGYTMKDEFMRRRGYDVTPYLPLICGEKACKESGEARRFDYEIAGDGAETFLEKLRTDYYSVISDLYVENTLKPLQEWLHTLGMKLRAEVSYGANFEISTPAKYVDGIETESFAQTADVDLYRGMLGAANFYGRPFSSETGAVYGHNYYYNMDTWTQLCWLQFAEGVVRTVFHGYSGIEGSESATYWPGHEGMYPRYPERFGGRQPAAGHYPEWTAMLGRCQKMLRQGAPRRDIAILRTDYRFVNYGKPKGYDTFECNYMMHDKAYFWRDLNLQAAGYTYDYFSPLLLLDEERTVCRGGELLPDGPGYRALVIYQQQLELACAEKLLEIARSGVPVIFVNDTSETITHDAEGGIVHGKAASESHSLSERDEDVRAVVRQIKALDNALEIDGTKAAPEALIRLGVQPRVRFAEENRRVLTCSRWDAEKNMLYTFAYCFKFRAEAGGEPSDFELQMEGEGQPYRMDEWSGKVEEIGAYRREGGRTGVRLSLIPGEAALILLDLSAADLPHALPCPETILRRDGALYLKADRAGEYEIGMCGGESDRKAVALPEAVSIGTWDITVEDWNEGEKVVNVEEKFGHTTREVWYTTKKTPLRFENCPLMAWKDLPATDAQLALLAGDAPSMAHVSGVGVYRSVFTLTEDWKGLGAVLRIGSAGGGTARVKVNGRDAGFAHTRRLTLDISEYVRSGENEIEIEVASTLTNRMLQRRYIDMGSAWTVDFPTVQDYGLQGFVRVEPYALVRL